MSLLVTVAALYMVAFMALIIRYRMRKGRIKIEVLHQDQTFSNKRVKPQLTKLPKLGGKDQDVNFAPRNVFMERKPLQNFWRVGERKVYYVDGMTECLAFSDMKQSPGLLYDLTRQQVSELVRKEVALSKKNAKPMDNMKFIIIIVISIIGLVLLLALMMRMGMLKI